MVGAADGAATVCESRNGHRSNGAELATMGATALLVRKRKKGDSGACRNGKLTWKELVGHKRNLMCLTMLDKLMKIKMRPSQDPQE